MFRNFLFGESQPGDEDEEEEDDLEDERRHDIGTVHLAHLKRSLTIDTTLESKETNQRVVDKVWFVVVVNSMTLLNSLQMGMEADFPEQETLWTVCENIFTAGFTIEMIIKLASLRWKYFKDRANWLDGTLTLLGILDCWFLAALGAGGADLQTLSILRVLRLFRLGRILKVVRSFKPFLLVIRGVMRAVSTTFYVFLMLIFIFYIFGIFFTLHLGHGETHLYPGFSLDKEEIEEQEIFANYNPHLCFGSMLLSMLTLFNMAIMAEWAEIVRPIALKQPQYVIFFVVFAMLVAFGVMNVMIGMIVDSVMEESKAIDETIDSRIKKQKLMTLDRIQDMLNMMDENSDGKIDPREFTKAINENADFAQLLRNINVPAGWSPDEFMAMLDNRAEGCLHKDEFTTSFFRLIDSDDFQQICILQASLNQAKFMIKNVAQSNVAVQDQLSAIQADITSLKTAMHQPAEGQTSLKIEKMSSEDAGEPCSEPCDHQCDYQGEVHTKEAERTSANVLAGCPDGICDELKEKIKHLSHQQLTDTLDAAYSVMKESFQKELASMQPKLETKLRVFHPECMERLPTELARVRPTLETKLRVSASENLGIAYMDNCGIIDLVIKKKDLDEHPSAHPGKWSVRGDDAHDCLQVSNDGRHGLSGINASEVARAVMTSSVVAGPDGEGASEDARLVMTSAVGVGPDGEGPDSGDEFCSAGSVCKASEAALAAGARTPDIGESALPAGARTPETGKPESEVSFAGKPVGFQSADACEPDTGMPQSETSNIGKSGEVALSVGSCTPDTGMRQSDTFPVDKSGEALFGIDVCPPDRGVQQHDVLEGDHASCAEEPRSLNAEVEHTSAPSNPRVETLVAEMDHSAPSNPRAETSLAEIVAEIEKTAPSAPPSARAETSVAEMVAEIEKFAPSAPSNARAETSVQSASTDMSPLQVDQPITPVLLDFEFGEDAPQLGFEIHWIADEQDKLPVIGRVQPSGAADVRGVRLGDHLAACNGSSVAGRAREEVLQTLRLRPLSLRMLRGRP